MSSLERNVEVGRPEEVPNILQPLLIGIKQESGYPRAHHNELIEKVHRPPYQWEVTESEDLGSM